MFNQSNDGIHWKPVDKKSPITYSGGGSSTGWGFDLSGKLYSLIQNEDGDQSGWGSRFAISNNDSIANWTFTQSKSSPYLVK